jgi:hypothetical protein
MAQKRIAIAWPEETIEALKDRHASSYQDHRLSFSAWLLSRVQLSFTVEEGICSPSAAHQ